MRKKGKERRKRTHALGALQVSYQSLSSCLSLSHSLTHSLSHAHCLPFFLLLSHCLFLLLSLFHHPVLPSLHKKIRVAL